MASRRTGLGVLMLLLAALPAGWARPARACINGMVERTDDRVPRVAAAERDLARGAPKASEPRALELLVDLEKRDLMPDASGYALLARLRRAIGDAPGSQRALARCREIAGKHDACSAS